MSSIYTKRDYFYYQRYWSNPQTGNTERVMKSLRTKDPQEAKELQERWDTYYDAKEANGDYEWQTVIEAYENYYNERKIKVKRDTLSENTLKSDRLAKNHFVSFIKNHVDERLTLEEIEPEHIRQFKEFRLKSVKPNTVANNLRHLQSFFSWLYKRQKIEQHPFDSISIPKTTRRIDIPSEKEWEFIKAELEREVSKKNPDPFFVALYIQSRTAMRIGEVIQLKWERGKDDYGEGQSSSYSFIDGKDAVIYFKKRKRRVPLNHVWHAIEKLERSENTAYLFESPNKGVEKPVLVTTWSRRTSKWFEDIDLSDRYTNHCLRHAAITELIRNDHAMSKVAQLAGHSHSRIVEIYTHVSSSDLRGMFD